MQTKALKLMAKNVRNPATWVVAAIAAVAFAVNVTPANSESNADPDRSDVIPGAAAYREGHKLHEVVGDFRSVGGRIVFVTQSREVTTSPGVGGGLVCLENLLLQRVAAAMKEQGSLDDWLVSGEVTEFQELNFVYLRTARRSE